jgi:type VI secretion system protein ImpH
MRATQRRIDPGLIQQTLASPERYEFFQLVRMYELYFRTRGEETVSEKIRFRNSLRLGFAPSQVDGMSASYRKDQEGLDTGELDQVEITPSFMGMLGVNGTLPIHYTERVIEHERFKRDTSGRAFLDMFSNRSVGHFYRAWKKYRLPIQYETNRQNRFLPLILSLSGLGFESLRQRLSDKPGAIEDESIAYFAGLLRQRPVSGEALRRVLGGYFRTAVRVEQFIGRWYVVPENERTMLGYNNSALGKDMLVGERVWQRNLRLRIRLGPLARSAYLGFMPRGELARALEKLLALATGGQFEYEISPVLRAEDVQPLALGNGQLGYDTFLLTRSEKNDRDDCRFLTQNIH